ncbi:hypothetical protein H6P81_010042 [Aristolochia fimbriata]|uniref:BHLH domain-containing protein n=1 Tax=Aristolochia fimbriata TaxID=158543 RepID=A0AAV7ER15_ARIFI|nr:hypothetical protein H6P81_010042 [Aristolochia fimbriata]
MASIETCTHYGNVSCTTGVVQLPLSNEGGSSSYGFEGDHGVVPDKNGGHHHFPSAAFEFGNNIMGHGVVGFVNPNCSEENDSDQSVRDLKGGFDHWACSSGSILSFGHVLSHGGGGGYSTNKSMSEEDEYSGWADVMDHQRLTENANCLETATGTNYNGLITKSTTTGNKENRLGEGETSIGGWLYSGESTTSTADNFPKSGAISQVNQHNLKRPYMGDEIQGTKKICGGSATCRKSKAKPVPSKDPQSIAAKNRRERISERLKVLQDLVPNGTKVDLVTMLEKAISYVKFLQLQVKVLATDEFWPTAGGKAPEVAQVKEAIDAILSSHRDRNSCRAPSER